MCWIAVRWSPFSSKHDSSRGNVGVALCRSFSPLIDIKLLEMEQSDLE